MGIALPKGSLQVLPFTESSIGQTLDQHLIVYSFVYIPHRKSNCYNLFELDHDDHFSNVCIDILIHEKQGRNLTGVMPVRGHFARQKHTHNKNARQVTYKVEISIFHVKGPYKLCMSNDMLKFYFPCHIYYIYICHLL